MIKAVRFRVRSRIRDRVRIKVLVQNATMTTTAANPNLDMTAVDPNSRVRNLDGPRFASEAENEGGWNGKRKFND